MTQVPYDDIRRALAEAHKVTPGPFKREAAVISQVQGDGWLSVMRAGQNVWNAEHAVAELVTLLLNNAEALLADAQRWRMIAEPSEEVAPIDMILHCPRCHLQHVDEPEGRTPGWTNPPHRSHLCHGCGCIWRPADVATNGVRAITTVGKSDTPMQEMIK